VSSPAIPFVSLLLVSLAASFPVAARGRVKSPIAGAHQQVPYTPLVIRMERQPAFLISRVMK
jgi:hypothetical protein